MMLRWFSFRNPSLFTFTVLVLCYFFYPSWKLLEIPRSALEPVCFAYLLLTALTFRVAQSGLAKNPLLPEREIVGTRHVFPEYAVLLVFVLILGLVHFHFLDWPILSGDDEAIHFKKQIWQFRQLSSLPVVPLVVLAISSTAIVLILSIISTPNRADGQTSGRFYLHIAAKYLLCGLLLYIALHVNMETASSLVSGWGWENRWPPLGTVLGAFCVRLFGENELAARIPALVFSLATVVFVYRIARQHSGWQGGAVAVAVLCSSPVFFQYGHLNFREAGGALFIAIAMYCLLEFHTSGSAASLHWALFAVAAGFLERRPVAGFLAVTICYSGYRMVLAFKELRPAITKLVPKASSLLLFHLTTLAVIYPWLQMSKGIRAYRLNLSNFFDLKLLTAYMGIFPAIVPWPIIVLLLAGVAATAVKKSASGLIALLTLLVFYALFTGDTPYWIPTERFTVLFVPPIAILCVQVVPLLRHRGLKYVMVSGLAVFMVASLLSWRFEKPLNVILAPLNQNQSSMPYYPFVELTKFLKDAGMNQGKILLPAHWQTPLEVYLNIQHLDQLSIVTPPWRKNTERKSTLSDLSKECARVGCSALLLRMTREGEKVDIAYLADLPSSLLLEDKIDSFQVKRIFFFKNNGLALLVPRQE